MKHIMEPVSCVVVAIFVLGDGWNVLILKHLFQVEKTETSGEWISYISIISSSMPRNRSFFFGEGTVLRQFNTTTGALKIGTHLGPSEPGQVYFGGTNF